MQTSAPKWSEDVVPFSFPDDLQTQEGVSTGPIQWAVLSVNYPQHIHDPRFGPLHNTTNQYGFGLCHSPLRLAWVNTSSS